jgi:hypothetical protein
MNCTFGQWETKLKPAGHAVIHDKAVVIDPFSDDSVVWSQEATTLVRRCPHHNDGNLAIIPGPAEAYAAHWLDVYDHYAWRHWLENGKNKLILTLPRALAAPCRGRAAGLPASGARGQASPPRRKRTGSLIRIP